MALPRMRTIKAAYQEIKQLDPNTALKESQLRRIVKSGGVQSVHVGNRILINLDILIDYLSGEAYQTGSMQPPEPEYGKLRSVAE